MAGQHRGEMTLISETGEHLDVTAGSPEG